MKSKTKIWDKTTFLTTFLAVFIVHGAIIFNKISWHDDVVSSFYGWNEGLSHGRWLYDIMTSLMMRYSGSESIPLVHGGVSAVCIGMAACILFEMFEIRERLFQVALILIFSSIPTVLGNFGYIGAAGYNFIGMLVCVCAAYVLCKGVFGKRNLGTFLLSAILFCCSLGIYQCYFSLYLSLSLIYFTKEIIQNEVTWKKFWGKGASYVSSAAVGLVFYLLLLQLFLKIKDVTLTNYAGTNTYGIVNIKGYLLRIASAYKEFLEPNVERSFTIFPFHWGGWYRILLITLFLLVIGILIVNFMEHNYKKMAQFLVALILLPCALNFNFILYYYDDIHSLHMYQFVLLFLYLLMLARENSVVLLRVVEKEKIAQWSAKIVRGVAVAVVFLFGVLYIRYDNNCYMMMQFRQEQAISYFTTLVTRIESTEGYKVGCPVAFVNEFEKKNSIDTINVHYDVPVTNPYSFPLVNSYSWKSFMSAWCGFEPVCVEASVYDNNQTVMDMPSYPNSGSIKIIDGIVVVKF